MVLSIALIDVLNCPELVVVAARYDAAEDKLSQSWVVLQISAALEPAPQRLLGPLTMHTTKRPQKCLAASQRKVIFRPP